MYIFGKIADNLKNIDFDAILRAMFVSENCPKTIKEWILFRLERGETEDGDLLITDHAVPPFRYSPYTVKQKKKYGQDFVHVTLEDTGDFYNSIKINFTEKGFEIAADFDKPDGKMYENFELMFANEAAFESAVIGLNDSEINELITILITNIHNKLIELILQR